MATTRLLSHSVTIRLAALIIFEALLFKLQPCRAHNLLAIVATSNGRHDRGRFQSGLRGILRRIQCNLKLFSGTKSETR